MRANGELHLFFQKPFVRKVLDSRIMRRENPTFCIVKPPKPDGFGGNSGASVLIGLFKKRCHTNGFSDFRVADFLVFTLQAVPEVPKSKPTS